MRVAAVEAIAVGLPFARPYVTSTGRLERREMLIVRIESADGVVGWGDAVPMSLRGGADLAAVHGDLERICKPALSGADLGEDPARLGAVGLDRCREAGAGLEALSGIDIALLDLAGRSVGEPVWRLLGAAASSPVACNATLGADPPEVAAAAAAGAVRAGFECLKVKVGDRGDRERMAAVRSAAGPAARLRIDANGAWSPAEAQERIDALAPLGIELAEQPCATVAELAELRARSTVPVVADESVNDLGEARAAMALGAIDAATLKLAKVGGPRAAIVIAAAAPSYLSSALDSALGIAAATHTVQAMPHLRFADGLAHGLATAALFADNVADDSPLSGPEIAVGDRPGLGIDVDEDAIERLRLR